MDNRIKALVGCEVSGKVREALRTRGVEAYSCDLMPSDDNSPYHYQRRVEALIEEENFDLCIVHPPCTALAVSGNRWYGKGCPKHWERLDAIDWTMELWRRITELIPHACMENPVGVLPIKPNQYIQPWEFGHGETKKTGLWLHNLPPLMPTEIVSGREQKVWRMGPGPDRAKKRSETYQGIADAMADQWVNHLTT